MTDTSSAPSSNPSAIPSGLNAPIPASPMPSPWSASTLLGLLATVAMLGVAWHRTFIEMWSRWFPAWERMPDAPLMDRLTKGDSYYSHGPLVGLTSLALIYFIYRRVGLPIRRTRVATLAGWAVLLAFLLLHLMSVLARVMFVSGFALMGVLAGVALIWGGLTLLRAYWLPIAVLVFMVPLPEVMVGDLNFRLKGVASTAAVWATNSIFHIPAIKDGSYVFLPPGAPGDPPKHLIVENVCSGLRSLISLTFFAALFAMICRVRGFWRIFMLLMAVPVAVLCNIIRITSLNVVAHYYGVEAVSEDGWYHGFSGMAVFLIALALLFGLEQFIVLSGRLLKQPWTDPRLLGYLDNLPRPGPVRLVTLRWSVLAALGITLGLTLLWSKTVAAPNQGRVAAGAVPAVVNVEGAPYQGRDFVLDEQTLTILETNDYLCRQYASSGRPGFELLIVFSPDNRKGTHPPDVCLEGSGEKILTKELRPIRLTSGQDLEMKEIITQRENTLTYHAFIYKCGDRYTTSFFMQQATIFANGMMARNTAGALIRFTTPIHNRDIDSARKIALAAAAAVMPEIDRGLP